MGYSPPEIRAAWSVRLLNRGHWTAADTWCGVSIAAQRGGPIGAFFAWLQRLAADLGGDARNGYAIGS